MNGIICIHIPKNNTKLHTFVLFFNFKTFLLIQVLTTLAISYVDIRLLQIDQETRLDYIFKLAPSKLIFLHWSIRLFQS